MHDSNFLNCYLELYNIAFLAFNEFNKSFIKQNVESANTLVLKAKEENKFMQKIKIYLISTLDNDLEVKQNVFN